MEKELPIGWIETDFDSIISRVSNGANLDQKDVYFKDSYPISRIETIAQETIDLQRVKYVEVNDDIIDKYCLKHGDILFSHINSDKHLGKTAYFDINTPVIHGINLLLIRCNDLYISKLLHFLFKYYRLKGKFIEVAQRSVNQSSINQKKLKEFPIPLPPKAEQKRIVDKLDTLFGHLDTLKTRLDHIPQLLKDFRQKVLTQAVTGKLTEEWREGRELAEWKTEALGNGLKDVKYGTSKKSEYETIGTPILRIPNIKNGEIDISDLKFSILDDKEYDSLKLNEGDILIIRSNGSISLVGQSAIIRKDLEGYSYAGYLIRLRVKKALFPDYLNYTLESHSLREQIVETARSTSGVNNINSQEIKDLIISFPPLEEQQEIVRRVESLFAKAGQIEASYQKLKSKIEQLPQALLAKAFRGELVEQLPTDGDARELLEQIKQAKAGLEKSGKSKKLKVEDELNVAAEPRGRYEKKIT